MARLYSLYRGAHHVTGGFRLYNKAVNRMRRRFPQKPKSKPAHAPKNRRARQDGALTSAHFTSPAPVKAREGACDENSGPNKEPISRGTTRKRSRSASVLVAADEQSTAAKRAKTNEMAIGSWETPQGVVEERKYFSRLAGGAAFERTATTMRGAKRQRGGKGPARSRVLEAIRRLILGSVSKGPPFFGASSSTYASQSAPVCDDTTATLERSPSAVPLCADKTGTSPQYRSETQQKVTPRGDHGLQSNRQVKKEEQDDAPLLQEDKSPSTTTSEKTERKQSHVPALIGQTVQEQESIPVPIAPEVEEHGPVLPLDPKVDVVSKPFPMSSALQLELERQNLPFMPVRQGNGAIPIASEVEEHGPVLPLDPKVDLVSKPFPMSPALQLERENLPFMPVSQGNGAIPIASEVEEHGPVPPLDPKVDLVSKPFPMSPALQLERQNLPFMPVSQGSGAIPIASEVEHEHGPIPPPDPDVNQAHEPYATSPTLHREQENIRVPMSQEKTHKREYVPVFFMGQDHVSCRQSLELQHDGLPFAMGQDFAPFSVSPELRHRSPPVRVGHTLTPCSINLDFTPYPNAEADCERYHVSSSTPNDNMVQATAEKTKKPRNIQMVQKSLHQQAETPSGFSAPQTSDCVQHESHQNLNTSDMQSTPRPLGTEKALGSFAVETPQPIVQREVHQSLNSTMRKLRPIRSTPRPVQAEKALQSFAVQTPQPIVQRDAHQNLNTSKIQSTPRPLGTEKALGSFAVETPQPTVQRDVHQSLNSTMRKLRPIRSTPRPVRAEKVAESFAAKTPERVVQRKVHGNLNTMIKLRTPRLLQTETASESFAALTPHCVAQDDASPRLSMKSCDFHIAPKVPRHLVKTHFGSSAPGMATPRLEHAHFPISREVVPQHDDVLLPLSRKVEHDSAFSCSVSQKANRISSDVELKKRQDFFDGRVFFDWLLNN